MIPIRNSPMLVALVGSAFVAVTYGLARFAFGLFLPTIRDSMSLGPSTAEIIGALPFATFVPASLIAPRLTALLGSRNAGVLAMLFALVGLFLIATATGPIILGIGVSLCGMTTGFTLPVTPGSVYMAILSAGAFGAAYMTLTGLLHNLLADTWDIGHTDPKVRLLAGF